MSIFSAECKAQPLSYNTCQEFIEGFDHLYEGRDKSVFPHSNPMKRETDIKFVKLALHGSTEEEYLIISQVQVFDSEDKNVALQTNGAVATQSSTLHMHEILSTGEERNDECLAKYAIDGELNENKTKDCDGLAVTAIWETNPWWQVELKEPTAISRVVIWNTYDLSEDTLSHASISLMNFAGDVVSQIDDIGDTSEKKRIELKIADFDVNKNFFSEYQFPLEYNFPRDTSSGVVDRTFRQEAFEGGIDADLSKKFFSLVDSKTKKALHVMDCESGSIRMRAHDKKSQNQQFKLINNDQLESVHCSDKVLSVQWTRTWMCKNAKGDQIGTVTTSANDGDDVALQECKLQQKSSDSVDVISDDYCADGNRLELEESDHLKKKQKWRFYEDGIVNVACGRKSGNLAITQVNKNHFNEISLFEELEFSFVNPSNGLAISVGAEKKEQRFASKSELRYAILACSLKDTEEKCKQDPQTYGCQTRIDSFDEDISNWDVSRVTNMAGMFRDAKKFNGKIGSWDVSKVTKMDGMFAGAASFNQNINYDAKTGAWNTERVADMNHMFHEAKWDVSGVAKMESMFYDAEKFNQDLNDWNVGSVTNMRVTDMFQMFWDAESFNQPLNGWNVQKVANMNGMFKGAVKFNRSLNSWDVGNVRYMQNMFYGATKFNQPLNGWNVEKVTDMAFMFYHASEFNGDISNWSPIRVENMRSMFDNARAFNKDITRWRIVGADTKINHHSKKVFGVMNTRITVLQKNARIGKNQLKVMEAQIKNNLMVNKNIHNYEVESEDPEDNYDHVENDHYHIEEDSSVTHAKEEKNDNDVALPLVLNKGVSGRDPDSILGGISYNTNSVHYLHMQVYDSRPSQLFKIKRVPVKNKDEGEEDEGDDDEGDEDEGDEEEVYQIYSSEYPKKVMSLADNKCLDNTDIVFWSDSQHDYAKWKITPGGTIENYYCKNIVIDISAYQARKDKLQSIDNLDARVQSYKKNDEWGQKWNIQSDMVVLSPIGVSDDDDGDSTKKSKQNSNQTWVPKYSDPGYELALLPGFPGETMSTSTGDQSCLSSTMDSDLANKAMSVCDESMSMLVGSQLSVGTLKEIADLFDPNRKNSVGTSMKCQNKGLWHLGISDEACENAGGNWTRTPCITLKETIDGRPSRFDLNNPVEGNCQTALRRLDTAFVSADKSHKDFKYQECVEFCQSLPDYSVMTGMEIKSKTSTSITKEDTECTCFYPNEKLPSKESMPTYATTSSPKFTLINSNGMALGLRPKIDCDAADELTVETQVGDSSNPRQQFGMTRDARVVSVRCPEKVLTAVLGADGSCAAGASLQVSKANFEANLSPLQQWKFQNDGTISNVKCPDLAIASSKENDVKLKSIYFSLQNERTQLAIGVKRATEGSCKDGMALEMQDLEYGSPNQQFIYEENEEKITSLMCPDFAITISSNGDGGCSTTDSLVLSNKNHGDDTNKWSFDNDSIQSLRCTNLFITISGDIGGRTKTVTLSQQNSSEQSADSSALRVNSNMSPSPKQDAEKKAKKPATLKKS
eukprot:scaffold29932_cov35-Cyclotella_meneghiniana.AAC.1